MADRLFAVAHRNLRTSTGPRTPCSRPSSRPGGSFRGSVRPSVSRPGSIGSSSCLLRGSPDGAAAGRRTCGSCRSTGGDSRTPPWTSPLATRWTAVSGDCRPSSGPSSSSITTWLDAGRDRRNPGRPPGHGQVEDPLRHEQPSGGPRSGCADATHPRGSAWHERQHRLRPDRQSWLQDGPTEMPDRSLQAALDEVHVTSQRRFGAARRTLNMNGNAFRLAGGRDGGLFIIVAGGIYLGNNQSGEIGGPPAATSSPAPTPAPSASPASPAMLKDAPYVACGPGGDAPNCLGGDLPPLRGCVAGRDHHGGTRRLVRMATLYTWDDAFDGLLVDAGTNNGSGWGLEFIGVGAVAKDPCDPAKGTYDRAETGTVDGLVAAMSRWPGFEAIAPYPHRGRRVQRAARRAHFHPHSRGLPHPVAVDDPPGRGGRRISNGRCAGAIAPGHVQDRGRQRHAARPPDDGLS